MTDIKKVLLASKADVDTLMYPLMASPKLDGIRCILHPTLGAVSRTLKPIPNNHIRGRLDRLQAYCLDGEIMTFTDGEMDDFNTVQSKVMSQDGEPDFRLLVFDTFLNADDTFVRRYTQVEEWVKQADKYAATDCLELVPHVYLSNRDELDAYEALMVEAGYEGIMVRRDDGHYKQGRSTVRQQILLKVKRFDDDEGVLVKMEEEIDKHGVPKDRLGAMVLLTKWGELKVGSGFTASQRDAYWKARNNMLAGEAVHVTFKYQPHGMKDRPRFPTFKGFRDRRDL